MRPTHVDNGGAPSQQGKSAARGLWQAGSRRCHPRSLSLIPQQRNWALLPGPHRCRREWKTQISWSHAREHAGWPDVLITALCKLTFVWLAAQGATREGPRVTRCCLQLLPLRKERPRAQERRCLLGPERGPDPSSRMQGPQPCIHASTGSEFSQPPQGSWRKSHPQSLQPRTQPG